MRQVARDIFNAYTARKSRTVGNTSIHVDQNGNAIVRLHGNAILEISETVCKDFRVEATLSGWDTPTTRSRLNDLFALFFGYMGDAPRIYRERKRTILRAHRETQEMRADGWHTIGLIPRKP